MIVSCALLYVRVSRIKESNPLGGNSCENNSLNRNELWLKFNKKKEANSDHINRAIYCANSPRWMEKRTKTNKNIIMGNHQWYSEVTNLCAWHAKLSQQIFHWKRFGSRINQINFIPSIYFYERKKNEKNQSKIKRKQQKNFKDTLLHVPYSK